MQKVAGLFFLGLHFRKYAWSDWFAKGKIMLIR